MSAFVSPEDRPVVPTFAECVLGYRLWELDDDGLLWPMAVRRAPWDVGVNTARCNCGTSDQLHFEWSLVGGQRRLEPAPLHEAPAETCRCGLYSLRGPGVDWAEDPQLRSGEQVVGAVASWGRLQVHATGVRAEFACVLALALFPGAGPAVVERIERAARRYGVESVSLVHLEAAAGLHAKPLPAAVHAAADGPFEPIAADEPVRPNPPTALPAIAFEAPRGADATEDEVGGPVKRSRPGALSARHAVLAFAFIAVLVLVLVIFDHHPSGCRIVKASGSPSQTVDCSQHPSPGR